MKQIRGNSSERWGYSFKQYSWSGLKENVIFEKKFNEVRKKHHPRQRNPGHRKALRWELP